MKKLNVAYRNNNLSEEDSINIEPLIAGDSNSGSSGGSGGGTTSTLSGVYLLCRVGTYIQKSTSASVEARAYQTASGGSTNENNNGVSFSWSGAASGSGTTKDVPSGASGCDGTKYNFKVTATKGGVSKTDSISVYRYPADWSGTTGTYYPSGTPNGRASMGSIAGCYAYEGCTQQANGKYKCTSRYSRCVSCPPPEEPPEYTVTVIHCVKGSNPCTKVHDDDITQNITYGTQYSKNGLDSTYLYENPPYRNRYEYDSTQDELVNVSGKSGIITTDNPTIKFYYRPKPATVRVRYYKKDTTTWVPGVNQDYEYTDTVYYDDAVDITQAIDNANINHVINTYCPNCGAHVPTGNFCGSCGTKIR